MAKTISLLLVGLGCLAGAAVLRAQTLGPRALEPVDHVTQAALLKALPTPTPSPEQSLTPQQLIASLHRASGSPSTSPSASVSGSASPVASPSASGSPDASASPSPSPSASSSASPSPSGSPDLNSQNPAELHQQAIVVDTHVESPFLISEQGLKLRSNNRQVSLEKLKTGGVDVVFFSIYVQPVKYAKNAKQRADYIIQSLKKEIAANQDLIELATSAQEIRQIVAKGKIAGLMGMEGGEAIGGDVNNVDYFYKQGVRYLSPTWSMHTLLADSSGVTRPRWKGLSPLGKQVIKRMNQLNMLVDVSHLSDASFYDVLKTSTQPVIASHSGVDGVRLSPRNLSNDMLKLLAVNGGVVGIMFYPPFLETTGKADVRSVVKHIEYAVKVAGIESVGLGSDFDGLDSPPPAGLQDASRFPAITAELKKQGYKNSEISAILGGNFMRVFDQVLK